MHPAELRAIRERRGYSRATMAAKLGIKVGQLEELEHGNQIISRLIENASRHIDATGGPEIPDTCEACNGFGMVERNRGPGSGRRMRCLSCHGLGHHERDRVIVA